MDAPLERRVKPRFRGVSHVVAFALTPAAAIGLTVAADSPRALAAGLVYSGGLAALFGVSALYHLPMWGIGPRRLLRSLDHGIIFLFIAASYTPFPLLMASPRREIMLAIAWGGASIGVVRAIVWPRVHRAVQIGLYI